MKEEQKVEPIKKSELRQIIKEEIKEAKNSFQKLIKTELYDIWDKKVTAKSKIAKEEQDLARVAEKTYKRTFWLMVFLVLSASFGNAAARWISGDSNLELIPKNIFDFIKDIIYVFIIPVTIKIIGDQAPNVVNTILALRGMQPINQNNFGPNQVNSYDTYGQNNYNGNYDSGNGNNEMSNYQNYNDTGYNPNSRKENNDFENYDTQNQTNTSNTGNQKNKNVEQNF